MDDKTSLPDNRKNTLVTAGILEKFYEKISKKMDRDHRRINDKISSDRKFLLVLILVAYFLVFLTLIKLSNIESQIRVIQNSECSTVCIVSETAEESDT